MTLIRKSEIDDPLKRLDKLIQEALMVIAVNVKVVHTVEDKATLVDTRPAVATSDEVISGA